MFYSSIRHRMFITALLFVSCSIVAADEPKSADDRPFTLWTGKQDPADVGKLPVIKGISYSMPQKMETGWRFLHGAAVVQYKGRLFVNWAHNPGEENTSTELVRGRRSDDGGKTWGDAELTAPGFEQSLRRHSHGTYLSHQGKLWCFVANFGEGLPKGTFPGLGTEAFTLDEVTDKWTSQGIVAQNCWPMDAPEKMADGNWIMGGLTSRITSCVAISHGDDLTKWDTVPIDWPEGRGFQETSVLVDGSDVTALIRSEKGSVAVAQSTDNGRTWSKVMNSNYPMAASKPFAGMLSTGQRFLISNIRNRHTLAIAVSKPGAKTFSRVWQVRQGEAPADYAGKVRGGAWAYPYAFEHKGKLYLVYSVRKRECEMAIIPIVSLVEE